MTNIQSHLVLALLGGVVGLLVAIGDKLDDIRDRLPEKPPAEAKP